MKCICQICNKEFICVPSKHSKFCSNECKSIGRFNGTIIKCVCCKKNFYVPKYRIKSAKFCSLSCGAKYNLEKFAHSKIRTTLIPQRLIKRNELKECILCGYKKIPQILERHHKDNNKLHREKENLSIVCPTCHEELHYLSKTGKWKNNKS